MTAIATSTIHATDTPTLEQMKIWWTEMQVDPTRFLAYPDYMPTDLDFYLEAVLRGEVSIWMFMVDDHQGRSQVGGAYYLHDGGEDADGRYSWFGAYIMPSFRGQIAVKAWSLILQQWHEQELFRLFAAIRATNRPAGRFITQYLKFTRLGIYQDWAPFQGVLDRMAIFTHRPADQSLAWVLAEQRALAHRASMVSATSHSLPDADKRRGNRRRTVDLLLH